jgi:hypothetical protein
VHTDTIFRAMNKPGAKNQVEIKKSVEKTKILAGPMGKE